MKTLLIVAVLVLGGCAGGPDMVGNDQGGMIDWFGTNETEVFRAATAHCGKYGKTAKITSIQAVAGGHVLFSCL